MSDRFTVFLGETQPSLKYNVTLDSEDEVLNPPTDTVKLQAYLSGTNPSTLLIDRAGVIEDGPTGLLRYDWQASDTALAGDLVAWWKITVGGNVQSTPAFVVPIIDHATSDPGLGVYASVLDVKALAGFLSDAWTQTSPTSEEDIAAFLAMSSGELDAILLSLGATLPLDPVGAPALALRSLTADGALVRALGATWPYNAPAGVTELRIDARTRYMNGLAELLRGTHPAALAIVSAAGGSSGGSSLWEAEPTYGRYGWYPDLLDRNPGMAPAVRKGQSF